MTDKRVTMIKPVVGKVKSPSYALPDDDHVYGIESKIDEENAGEVVQSWAQSKSSEPSSMQSFPATTRLALKNGCLTSKTQSEYGKQNPVMKHRYETRHKAKNVAVDTTASANQDSVVTQQPLQEIFGIQSKENEVSMTELLRCIPSELEDERDYPDLSGKKRKGSLPQAKATKSSLSVAKCREPQSDEKQAKKKAVEEFKLTKFKKVESIVKKYMT